MTPTLNTVTALSSAAELRAAMVEGLRRQGAISSPAVEAAFRAVPRHWFVPEGTPLAIAYDALDPVPVKRAAGEVVSSTSAPFIQARMIEQARLEPGSRVLEVGSGGYNAALLAEVVGADGQVTSVDIDPQITDLARRRLVGAGYSQRTIRVVDADADASIPGLECGLDAILVTAGAWDLSPAWIDLLAPDGVLVVPLVMNGVTRSIAFRRSGEHLASSSAEVCGFVPMQGAGAHDGCSLVLPHSGGGSVRLRMDTVPASLIGRLDGVLAAERAEVWSGVRIGGQVSFADLQLWLACFLPGFCRVAITGDADLAPAGGRWWSYGAVIGDALTYLTTRPGPDGAGAELGATGYGPHPTTAARALAAQIQAWDQRSRRGSTGPGTPPVFAYWPAGTRPPAPTGHTAVLGKTHGQVTISWPAARTA